MTKCMSHSLRSGPVDVAGTSTPPEYSIAPSALFRQAFSMIGLLDEGGAQSKDANSELESSEIQSNSIDQNPVDETKESEVDDNEETSVSCCKVFIG